MDSRLSRNKMEYGRMFADLWMKRWFHVYSSLGIWPDRKREVRTVEASSPHLEIDQVDVSVVLCAFQKPFHPLIQRGSLGWLLGIPDIYIRAGLSILEWTSGGDPARRPRSRKGPICRSWALLSPDLSAVLCNLCLIGELKVSMVDYFRLKSVFPLLKSDEI